MTTEEKFHAAVNVIRSLPKNGSYQPSNELMLRFYGYFKQATLGPCKGARPAFWDVVGRAKYDAWKKLGDMGKQDAMHSYVTELHRIVETMSYTDNVANFLEAQTELDAVPLDDLELIAGDVMDRVRSQPNSPFASREASPQRIRSSLDTTPASSPSVSPPPLHGNHADTDHSDDEYIDTLDSEPDYSSKKPLANGHRLSDGGAIANGYARQSRPKTKGAVDIGQEVARTVQSLRDDLERLNRKVHVLEKASTVKRRGGRFSFATVSPLFLAFVLVWPFVAHRILRSWPNRK